MKNTFFSIILILFFSLILSGCGSKPKSITDAQGEIQNVIKHDTDRELRTMIVGIWNTVETVRGEILVFDSLGNYSGYDGREEFKGTWKIEKQKLTLSLGGTYNLIINKDTMYMDECKYIRENSSLTEK